MTAPSDISHGGLAVRYRPRRFAELTGQRHVAAVLCRAIAAGRVPHQILLSGGSGLGKTTVGRIASAAILCTTPLEERADPSGRLTGDACGTCDTCLDIFLPGRHHPDVIEFDAASHGTKDDIADIASRAAFAPIRGGFKIYIIDEAHALSGAGGQAFLKLLEEPPPHVIFILATTNPEKLTTKSGGSGTIVGRCTHFELLRPSDAEILANLQRVATGEGWTLSERVATAVLAATDPTLGVRGTLMTLEKLSEALAWAQDPDDDELAMLLGVAPATQVAVLTDAIEAGDRAAALAALTDLRARASDSSARSALITWARRRFLDSLAGGTISAELAQWRYETLVGAPAGDLWTEITISKLTNPELSPSVDVLAAQLAEASRVIAELRTATSGAVTQPSAVVPAAAVEPPEPAAEEHHDAEPPLEAAPIAAEPAAAESPAAPAPSAEEKPARRRGPVTPDMLIAAVEHRSKKAGAILRACEIVIDGDVATVTPPAPLRSRLADVQAVLEDAAVAGKLTLRVAG